jgi:hypothetical protein
MTKYLILPMFSMVVLSFAVAAAMLRARIRAVQSGHTKMGYFKTFSESQPTEEMLKTAQHFTNLFEVPVLFYAACLAAIQIQVPGIGVHLWAWVFVISRFAHAMIHIRSNKIKYRMRAFALSVIAMLALWVYVLIQLFRA